MQTVLKSIFVFILEILAVFLLFGLSCSIWFAVSFLSRQNVGNQS